MRAFSYITYQDILIRDPISSFSARTRLNKHETQMLMVLCETHGLSGAIKILKTVQAKKMVTFTQLRYLYNEIKLRKLLLDLLRGGATISGEAVLDRAERFKGLVRVIDGERVLVGTYRDLVQRPKNGAFNRVRRRKLFTGDKHPDVV